MGRAGFSVVVPGRAADAEALYYDPHRWASWVDGFGHIVKLEGDWPEVGARLLWQSPPGGRGLVQERVVAYEMRSGQTVEVEDEKMRATQRVTFKPRPEDVEVAIEVDYEIKDPNAFTPLVDLLFVRRAMSDALRRTLSRFANERKAEIQFG